MLVIAGAALRVADLCRFVELSDFCDPPLTNARREAKPFKSKDIDVAKLFSKHFKLSEHIEYLNKTKVSVAVGTPGRIGKLFTDSGQSSPHHIAAPTDDVLR